MSSCVWVSWCAHTKGRRTEYIRMKWPESYKESAQGMSETTAGTGRKMLIGVVLILLVFVVVLAVGPWRGPFSGAGTVNVTRTVTEPFTETVTVTENAQTGTGNQLLEYCFSPGGDCASVITRWIDRAKVSVHVLIYDFTLNKIGDAVMRAKNRGVDVRIVLESGQCEGKRQRVCSPQEQRRTDPTGHKPRTYA